MARLQEVTPSSGPERWAIAPSYSAFVTASRGCQKELQHRFLKCFAVARTARCCASRASGKSRPHRSEPRRGERSQCELRVEPEAEGDCSRCPSLPAARAPTAELLSRPPPRVEGSMLAVGCTLLVVLLVAPAVALVLGSCRALGKRNPERAWGM